VTLDPERLGRDTGHIAEEIVQHLVALRGDQALSDVEAGRFPDEKLGIYAGW
jgi:hypothetical protein